MEFHYFPGRTKSLVNFETFKNPPAEYKETSRFTVCQGEMVKKTVTKTKFFQLNDKQFYFPDGIVSLLYGHHNLKEIEDFKKQKRSKNREIFSGRKIKIIKH